MLVERPKTVKLQYTNYQGKLTDVNCEGLLARIVQHELDHLDGKIMEDMAIKTHPISALID